MTKIRWSLLRLIFLQLKPNFFFLSLKQWLKNPAIIDSKVIKTLINVENLDD